MKRLFANRKMIFAVLTIFVFVFAIQMAEPATAAKWKKFDKGSRTVYTSVGWVKLTWKSYKKGNNYAKVKVRYYYYNQGYTIFSTAYFTKINKKKLKVKLIGPVHTYTKYVKTRKNAAQFARWWIRYT